MIVIIDFGSQTAHLIERRIKAQHVETAFITPDEALPFLKSHSVLGIILSGGPASVYGPHAPRIPAEIFSLGTPLLAICYGAQLTMHMLGGKISKGKKEYGPATLKISNFEFPISQLIPEESTVWMSHGDAIETLPVGFRVVGETPHAKYAVTIDEEKRIITTLFHPEVEHTEYGNQVLRNFIAYCKAPKKEQHIDSTSLIETIRTTVGSSLVIGAVSGGVDSTVAAALTAKAIGKQFLPIYVDNGLMRVGTTDYVKEIFAKLGIPVKILRVEQAMLTKLKGITDPEQKRKLIGAYYIELFEAEMQRLVALGKPVHFLLQGTIYSDVIESKGTKHASKIKSHHNVGGLPKHMKLRLLEPLRTFYKDEVRSIGRELGLPAHFVDKQPFPGPGYAIRIRGEVTKERLKRERIADAIVLEEIEKAGLMNEVFISFAIMSGAESTAVKGDGRFFGEVVAVRVVNSQDVMTSTWTHLPYSVLQAISSRIINEVPGISRVVYDITTKPPATMEWE